VVETRVGEEPAPVDHAVALLREIADAAAMRSSDWALTQPEPPNIATRAVIELLVRLYDVDQWAAALGIPLAVDQETLPEEAWPDAGPRPALGVDDLLRAFGRAAHAYERAAEVRHQPGGPKALHNEAARAGACELIYATRSWHIWARRQPEAQPAAISASMVFMAEACFIATWERVPAGPLPPDREFLTALLASSGAPAWAVDHGFEIPDWLT
jgi:hypothetical protein